ncbi:MAG: hypothetical protein IJH37_02470 [Clostridia bacterium]|nr:hypothetical protein [Clostridia bacterium]
MKDTTKKVVILDNLSSPYVHQAIIVMREFDPRLESRAVTDAERIVGAYLDNMKLNSGNERSRAARYRKKEQQLPATRKKRVFPLFFAIAAVLLVIAAVVFRF